MERLRQNVAMIEAQDRGTRLHLESPDALQHRSRQISLSSEHARLPDESASNVRMATQQPETPPQPQEQCRRDHDSRLVEKELKSPDHVTTDTLTQDPWVPRPVSDEPAPWMPRSIQRV